jgi:hypothetical protein
MSRTSWLFRLSQGLVNDLEIVVDIGILQQVGQRGLRLLTPLLPRIGSVKRNKYFNNNKLPVNTGSHGLLIN